MGQKIGRCAVINYSQAFIDNVDGVGKPYLVVIMHDSSSWDKHNKLAPTFLNSLFIIYNNFLVISTVLMRLTTIKCLIDLWANRMPSFKMACHLIPATLNMFLSFYNLLNVISLTFFFKQNVWPFFLLPTSQIYRLHGFVSNSCKIYYFMVSYHLNTNVVHYLNSEVMCMIIVYKQHE